MIRVVLTVFVLGAVLGTVYDTIHVVFGVLTYSHPHFTVLGKGQSWWVPLEFGGVGGAAIPIVRLLMRRFGLRARERLGQRALWDGLLLLAGYLVTGIFVGNNAATFAGLLVLALAFAGLFIDLCTYLLTRYAA